jgi:catechol 2,3-dioxygenase-like lactoylglutathione lyase family enzyme
LAARDFDGIHWGEVEKMAVVLDHMSVPARDKVATAEWYAHVFGVSYEGPRRDFAPLALSPALTLNFEEGEISEHHHYAFRVAPDEFRAVQSRLVADGVPFGSTTQEKDGEAYARGGLLGFYFDDPNGHGLEIITSE